MNQITAFRLSRKRQALCSHDNAVRVAARLFDETLRRTQIIRTGDPLQPYRIVQDACIAQDVILEMVA